MVIQTAAVFQPIPVHFFDVDIVCILQNAHLFTCDIAQNSHSKARPREGVTLNQMLGHLQLVAHTAHLVLEQPPQRFAQLQLHILWQTAYIVVALDGHSGYAQALYAVWVDGSLG